MVYRRVAFSPLPPSPVPYRYGGDGRDVKVTLPPPVSVFMGRPLSELRLLGAEPALVAADREVLSPHVLKRAQIARLDSIYAVLTEKMALRLGLPAEVARPAAGARITSANVAHEVEGLIRRCFPGGGEAEGCPLKLRLSLCEVPVGRILKIDDAHRTMLFGEGGEGQVPREGLARHGAYRPPEATFHTLVMLHPEGERHAARRLFRMFVSQQALLPVIWTGDEAHWLEYEPGEGSTEQLLRLLCLHPETEGDAKSKVYCLLVPSAGKTPSVTEQGAVGSVRRLVEAGGAHFVGPVPLHAVGSAALERFMPTLLSRLSLRMGGLPWMPAHYVSQDSDLVAGISCTSGARGVELSFAAAFYDAPARYCRFSVCGTEHRFAFLFGGRLHAACRSFANDHDGAPPRRLVVYFHHDLPRDMLSLLDDTLKEHAAKLPALLVSVRRTAGDVPRCYDNDTSSGMPAAGTCVTLSDGLHHLFCHDARAGHAAYGPAPLEAAFYQFDADGGLQPLSPYEEEHLPAQLCQLVWANPRCVDGCALPLILGYTDEMLRKRESDRRSGRQRQDWK